MRTSQVQGRANIRWIIALHECVKEGREVFMFSEERGQLNLFTRRLR